MKLACMVRPEQRPHDGWEIDMGQFLCGFQEMTPVELLHMGMKQVQHVL